MSDPHRPAAAGPRWGLLLLILSVTCTGQLSFAVVPPVLPEMAGALGVSRSGIGLV